MEKSSQTGRLLGSGVGQSQEYSVSRSADPRPDWRDQRLLSSAQYAGLIKLSDASSRFRSDITLSARNLVVYDLHPPLGPEM